MPWSNLSNIDGNDVRVSLGYGNGSDRSQTSSMIHQEFDGWDTPMRISQPSRWQQNHLAPDPQIHLSRSSSNSRGLETIVEDMPTPAGRDNPRRHGRNSDGVGHNYSSELHINQQRRHSEGDILETSSANRYSKRTQAPNSSRRTSKPAPRGDKGDAARQGRRKSYTGNETLSEFDDRSEVSDAHSVRSSRSRLSVGSEESLSSASRLASSRRSDTYTSADTASSSSLVGNDVRRKSRNGSQILSTDERRSSLANDVDSPKGPSTRRLSALTIGGDDVSPSPFSTIEIPVELFDNPTSRARKLMAPVILVILATSLLVSLVVAIYFAVILKNSQEQQIEFLQFTLKFALARDSQSRDLSTLTLPEQDQLKGAYCKQVDDIYKSSALSTTYRGCELDMLTKEKIEFKLYFLQGEDLKMQEASTVEVLASRAQLVGQRDSALRKISDITIDISNSSRSITVEKTRRLQNFYSKMLADSNHSPPAEARTNLGNIKATPAPVAAVSTTKKAESTSRTYHSTTSTSTMYPSTTMTATSTSTTYPSTTTTTTSTSTMYPSTTTTTTSTSTVYPSTTTATTSTSAMYPSTTTATTSTSTMYPSTTTATTSTSTMYPSTTMATTSTSTMYPSTTTATTSTSTMYPSTTTATTSTSTMYPSTTTATTSTSTMYPSTTTATTSTSTMYPSTTTATTSTSTMYPSTIIVPTPAATTAAPTAMTTTFTAITATLSSDFAAVTSVNSAPYLPRPGVNNTVLREDICSTIQPGEIVAHPNDCTHYIQCDFMTPIVRPCSGGLVFDSETSSCVVPAPGMPCTEVKPCENINGGYFAHPTNCQLYIVCDRGTTVVQSCQGHMIWDQSVQTCLPNEMGQKCYPS